MCRRMRRMHEILECCCTQRYRFGNVIAISNYSTASGQIWLDDVQCTGEERDIGACKHLRWGYHNCGHSEDIALSCENIVYSGICTLELHLTFITRMSLQIFRWFCSIKIDFTNVFSKCNLLKRNKVMEIRHWFRRHLGHVLLRKWKSDPFIFFRATSISYKSITVLLAYIFPTF